MTEGYGWDQLIKTANDAGFFVLPVGDYACRITNADVRKSGTGKDQIKVRWEVLTGPMVGKSVNDNMTISPESATAVAIFFRQMDAIGLTEDFFKGGQTGVKPSLPHVASAMVGRTATLSIGHREWNNQTQMDVKAIRPLQGVGGAPMPQVGGPPVPGVPAPPVAPPMPPVPTAPQPQMVQTNGANAPAPAAPPPPMAPPAPMAPPPPFNPGPTPPAAAPVQPIPPAPIEQTATPAASAPAPPPVPASTPSPAPAPASTETPASSPAPAPTAAPVRVPSADIIPPPIVTPSERPAPPPAPF